MAPVLRKGLICCLSLRTCALILGSITLVGNLMTLSMFVVGLGMWLGDGEGHLNHTEVATNHMDDIGDMDLEVHGHVDYGFDDSETMEELLQSAPYFAMVVLWLDFFLVVLETLSVILLIWGAAKRIAVLLLPWLVMELATTLYDLGFFAYLFLQDVYITIDLLPVILLPVTIYCWLVVFSLYQECKETTTRNSSMPLSMSALEAGLDGQTQACTVPYGRMAAG